MVGRKTKKKLKDRGINTIGEFAILELSLVQSWLKKHGEMLWNFANGREFSPVYTQREAPKSIGNSSTFSFDLETESDLRAALFGIAERVGKRMREKGFEGRVVSISYRNKELSGQGFQRTLPYATDQTEEIFAFAWQLFSENWKGEAIRSMGITMSQLEEKGSYEINFFRDKGITNQQVDEVIDEIREEYGTEAVFRGSFLHGSLPPVIGGVLSDEDYTMMSSLL